MKCTHKVAINKPCGKCEAEAVWREEEFPGPLVYTLNERQWEHFMHTMQNPKPPTPEMIEAARKLQEWTRRPGDLEYDSWQLAADKEGK